MRIAMLGVKGIPHPGGIEKTVEELGSRLVNKGHEVIVYVRPHYTRRGLSDYRGMRLVALPSIATKHLDAITHTSIASLSAVAAKADIAHIHSIGLSPLASITRGNGIKTVVQSHGLDWQRGKWGRLARAYLKCTDYCTVCFPDATTAVSKKMKGYYESRFGRAVTYIPNGVNVPLRVEPSEIHQLGIQEREYILYASRLVPEKGCHDLVRAYRSMDGCPKKLVIAGDSNYRSRYVDKLKNQASESVLFLGFVRGRLLRELMSNAYIYVQPSYMEGLSMALLEAMSYQNCVVVSDIEENLEAIGDAGVSFKVGDWKELRAELSRLLCDDGVVRELGRRARQSVCERYNWDCAADQYEELYESLLR